MKILATTPIPTEELFKLRSECEALYNHVNNLLHLSYVETPAEETPKPEVSSKSEEVEAPSEEEASSGLVFHNRPNKSAIEMIIE